MRQEWPPVGQGHQELQRILLQVEMKSEAASVGGVFHSTKRNGPNALELGPLTVTERGRAFSVARRFEATGIGSARFQCPRRNRPERESQFPPGPVFLRARLGWKR